MIPLAPDPRPRKAARTLWQLEKLPRDAGFPREAGVLL